ncbi:MAG: DUF3408 domain-containing protein [Prevotellaceae bacterium]|jgi:hypothetical protein|nr:DUF3408 domain-containing protein [Prevotellaceae bacterium]
MAKKLLNEADVLARMAGNFQEQTGKIEATPEVVTTIENPVEFPEKEKKTNGEDAGQQSFPSKEVHGNGKKNTYEKKFLSRDICGIFRTNVGVSKDTLNIAERIIARVFDNKIAVGAYVDNILLEHFNKYREDFEVWLVERPVTIF